jgi:uncharacterized protein (TIGR00251 family)
MAFLKVRVKPRSSRRAVLDCRDGVWQVSLTSPPEGGKANKELLKLLSKMLKIAVSQMEIQSGEKSRNKSIAIPGLSEEEISARLREAT